MRELDQIVDHSLFDDLPELDDCGIDDLLFEVEFDALDLMIGSQGFVTAADLVHDMPALGPRRQQMLLRTHPTVAALLAATKDDLARLPGFGPATVRLVMGSLRATVKAA